MSSLGTHRLLLDVSLIHSIVSLLSVIAWLTKAPHASSFVCVRLYNEGKRESWNGFNGFRTLQQTCT